MKTDVLEVLLRVILLFVGVFGLVFGLTGMFVAIEVGTAQCALGEEGGFVLGTLAFGFGWLTLGGCLWWDK